MKFSNKHVWIVFSLLMTVGLGLVVSASMYSAKHYSCNTLLMDLKGDLVTSYATNDVVSETAQYVTYSNEFAKLIEQLDSSDTINAIIVDVDSYGGLPVAGEEIANALKRSQKENVAVIHSAGLSSAYWAASGAKRIFASRNSDVGSIGVSLQLRNLVEKNKQEGIRVTSITSGQFKGIGDPNRELTKEEKDLLQIDVDKIHDNFVNAISENRNLPKEKVSSLATGASMLGDKALESGLVDEIGDFTQAKAYLEAKLGAGVRICTPPPSSTQ